MVTTAKVSAPYALVLVMDSTGGDIPGSMGHALIASTPSCIAIGCRSEQDGAVELTLSVASEVCLADPPVFSGFLETPSRRVEISTVLGDTILGAISDRQRTLVQVWVDDPREPGRIIVGIE